MAEAFIVRRGGGGSGGTLVVTSSGAGTVTVSNSVLGKSYSKSVTAGGSVTFKGLKTGEWTVTLSNGVQTTTRPVTINADYSVSVAYFSATISITYPATSTCVVTNSSGQTVASDTNTGSSTKTWTATVNETGTYTVTATATDGSGKSKSQTVNITTDGQSESITLTYIYYLQQGATIVVQPQTSGVTTEVIDDTVKYKGTATEEIKIVDFGIVNLTGFSKITVDVLDGLTYSSPLPGICISAQKLSGYPSDNVTRFEGTAQGSTAIKLSAREYYLDLSSISGEYYVSMFWKGFGNKNAYIQTSNIWIE